MNATDPNASLKYAANWMAQLIHKYGGAAPALSVYNSGNPTAYRNPAFAGGQTYNYVKNILAKAGAGAVSPPQLTGPPRPPGQGSLPQQGAQVQRFKTTNLLPLLKILGLGNVPGISDLAQIRAPLPPNGLARQRVLPGKQITPKFQVQGKVTANDVAAVQLAKNFIGTPYVWGGTHPGGFDCSGLIQYVWAQRGVSIPRTTYDQVKAGLAVQKNQLRPGDAVFFTGSDPKNGLPGHVAMFIGNGRIIEAPHSGATVRISSLAGRNDYAGARRYG